MGEFFSQLAAMKGNGKPFLLYGYNSSAELEKLLKLMGIVPAGVVDDDAAKRGQDTAYGKIISFDDAVEKGTANFNYIIVIGYGFTLRKKLKTAGVRDENIACLNYSAFDNVMNDKAYLIDHWEEALKTAELFADGKSKEQYLEVLKFRLHGDWERLEKIGADAYNQYLDPLVPFSEREIYADVGAFDGKTVLKFIRRVGGKYDKIYAIEASPQNMAKARANTAEYADIEYVECAVSDREGVAAFDETPGSAAKIDAAGKTIVQMRRLDDILKDGATFIKMDIEGGRWLHWKGHGVASIDSALNWRFASTTATAI